MKRREFLHAAGAAALTGLVGPPSARAQPALRFADMHAHLRFKQAGTMRQFMTANGMLVVAEKVVADGVIIRWSRERQVWAASREARPGDARAASPTTVSSAAS